MKTLGYEECSNYEFRSQIMNVLELRTWKRRRDSNLEDNHHYSHFKRTKRNFVFQDFQNTE
uniref:protein FAM104B-like n=1 Tax=Urocitellus parryii TaxID=9999 RepID=UPI000E55C600